MNSHIVPAFFRDDSASMYPTGKLGTPQPFTQPIHTEAGKRFDRKQHGHYERQFGHIQYLLCRECEAHFSNLEDYAKRLLYGGTKPIRIQLPLSQTVFEADYSKLRLFQLSLLWRATEARGAFFSAVKLSAIHSERLRQMLLNSDPGKSDDFFCIMSRLVASGPVKALMDQSGFAVETGLFAPVCRKLGSWNAIAFMMGGVTWTFFVGDDIPSTLKEQYIKENGQFGFQQMDGNSFYIEYATKAVQAGNVTQADAEESERVRVIRSAHPSVD